MQIKNKARILINKEGKKVAYIPSFELEIFEGDILLIERENRRLIRELKLMTVNASSLQNKVKKLEKENKKMTQAFAKKKGVLIEKRI